MHLVSRKSQEIYIQRAHIYCKVRHRLRSVQQSHGAGRMSQRDDLRRRVDGAEDVGHVCKRDQLRALV